MPLELTEPQRLDDIIDKLDAKTPVGSVMRTEQWLRVPQGLRDGAMFSASVTSVRYLQEIQSGIKAITERARSVNEKGESYWTMDRSRLIADLRGLGEQLGITHPESTGRPDGKIREKDLTDPLSVARLKLVVNTQMEMGYGYGDWLTSQDPVVLNEWPCWELVRISPRVIHRDWLTRWREAGGTTHDGRMIAPKTSPVWVKISRFGNPYPPFDFNSGMGVEEIGRDEAEALGLIKAGHELQPVVKDFQEGLKASVKNIGPKERAWLKKQLGDQVAFEGDEVRWADFKPDVRPPVPKKKPAPAPAQPPPAPGPRTLATVNADIDALATEHAAAMTRMDECIAAQGNLARGSYGTPAFDRAKQATEQARTELNVIRERGRVAIEIPASERGSLKWTLQSTQTPGHFDEGRGIVERFVHAKILPEIQVKVKAGRAHCQFDGTIHVNASQTASMIAHEIVHAIEMQHSGVLTASQDFLATRRKAGEKAVKLGNVYPHQGYGADEITIEDEWMSRGGHAYSGKLYFPGVSSAEMRRIWHDALKQDPQEPSHC
jgi:hypothetical protein